ncbi:MAG: DEAD/DEAH box helicase family protein [Cetobacterium sp.]
MINKLCLYDELNSAKKFTPIRIPEYITSNVKYNLFFWQKNALENLILLEGNPSKNNHFMFNMATGSGKTLVMASIILYYYTKGYKNFLFVTNQNNIIEKTKLNLLQNYSTKYLYKDKIFIDNREVLLKEVNNFSLNNMDNIIEIKFSTLQQLYSDINQEKENQITLEELLNKDIIILADEAHHLNSSTKKINQKFKPESLDGRGVSEEDVEAFGWEKMIREQILQKNGLILKENKNRLIEFTATIPTEEEVFKKYKDKIIYKFDLKRFLQEGYTKEINLVSSTFDKKQRILHMLLINWYRHDIALRNNIPNFKPVILFKSEEVATSKLDYDIFLNIVENITNDDFKFLETLKNQIIGINEVNQSGYSITEKVLNKLKGNYYEVIKYIKNNFKEENIIITNSKLKLDSSIETKLNSLEEVDNNIRVIFTVDRLTEGWDVLNLYEIVRMKESQNSGGGNKNKASSATIEEKQLIGRGVRYYPFNYLDKEKNKRKFDNDVENELRMLEELFYYTYDEESRYITDLKNELKKEGYISENGEKIQKRFYLKNSFKETKFYTDFRIMGNKKRKKEVNRRITLKELKDVKIEIKLNSTLKEEDKIFDNERYLAMESDICQLEISVKDIPKHIFNKALNRCINTDKNLFAFKNLKNKLGITTIDDLLKEKYLGDFKVLINSANTLIEEIEGTDFLKITEIFLKKIFTELEANYFDEEGTEFEPLYTIEELFGEEKVKIVKSESINNSAPLNIELSNKPWYVLNSFVGTSEEISCINFLKNNLFSLEKKYEEVYLLRNEEVYKIYDFDTGRGFQPDFLLFLKGKDNKNYYQVFIEPKGTHLLENDEWKNKFLKEITERYKGKNLFEKYSLESESLIYTIIGLPLYNGEKNEEFKDAFKKI